jgi:hypothetical protein
LEKDAAAGDNFLEQWDFRDSIVNAIYKESSKEKAWIPSIQKVVERENE